MKFKSKLSLVNKNRQRNKRDKKEALHPPVVLSRSCRGADLLSPSCAAAAERCPSRLIIAKPHLLSGRGEMGKKVSLFFWGACVKTGGKKAFCDNKRGGGRGTPHILLGIPYLHVLGVQPLVLPYSHTHPPLNGIGALRPGSDDGGSRVCPPVFPLCILLIPFS